VPYQTVPNFRAMFRAKPLGMQAAVARTVQQMETDLRHPGLRVHRVQGTRDTWEARINGGNRITFRWDGGIKVLLANCTHQSVLGK
jgi:hypothetical protein